MYRIIRGTPAGAGSGRLERAIPWPEVADGWSPSDRVEYERALRQDVVRPLSTAAAPALLRESLMSLGSGAVEDDDELRRELRRVPAPEVA